MVVGCTKDGNRLEMQGSRYYQLCYASAWFSISDLSFTQESNLKRHLDSVHTTVQSFGDNFLSFKPLQEGAY